MLFIVLAYRSERALDVAEKARRAAPAGERTRAEREAAPSMIDREGR